MDRNDVVLKMPAVRKYRRHSEEFKRQIIEACLEPGVSVSAIAVANQLNTNMVRNWLKAYREQRGDPPQDRRREPMPDTPAPTLVPVTIQDTGAGRAIRVSIRMTGRKIQVDWPVTEARSCIQWLHEVLR